MNSPRSAAYVTSSSIIVVTLTLLVSQLHADVSTFQAADAGANRFDPRPNSLATAATFDFFAGLDGPVQIIDLENLFLFTAAFSPEEIAPGVLATLTNSNYPSAVLDEPNYYPSTVTGSVGYNTTSGGDQFFGMTPQFGSGTFRLTLDFSTPIQAFGTYLTGFQRTNGDLYIVFDDGTDQTFPYSGSSAGGAGFVGFTDPGASISRVALELRGITAVGDAFAIDDLRYVASVAVPEPATLLTTFGFGLSIVLYRRR